MSAARVAVIVAAASVDFYFVMRSKNSCLQRCIKVEGFVLEWCEMERGGVKLEIKLQRNKVMQKLLT